MSQNKHFPPSVAFVTAVGKAGSHRRLVPINGAISVPNLTLIHRSLKLLCNRSAEEFGTSG